MQDNGFACHSRRRNRGICGSKYTKCLILIMSCLRNAIVLHLFLPSSAFKINSVAPKQCVEHVHCNSPKGSHPGVSKSIGLWLALDSCRPRIRTLSLPRLSLMNPWPRISLRLTSPSKKKGQKKKGTWIVYLQADARWMHGYDGNPNGNQGNPVQPSLTSVGVNSGTTEWPQSKNGEVDAESGEIA